LSTAWTELSSRRRAPRQLARFDQG
jgi:hypothetical protein